jgi:hypothetical protein
MALPAIHGEPIMFNAYLHLLGDSVTVAIVWVAYFVAAVTGARSNSGPSRPP